VACCGVDGQIWRHGPEWCPTCCPKFDKKIAVEQPPVVIKVHTLRVYRRISHWRSALDATKPALSSNGVRIFRVTHGGVASLALFC